MSNEPEHFEDCQNCKHTHGATCLSPEYKKMSDEEQRVFWRELVPCCFFEEQAHD